MIVKEPLNLSTIEYLDYHETGNWFQNISLIKIFCFTISFYNWGEEMGEGVILAIN